MHILVTGATGFIGRHTVNALLARGHGVSVVVRDPRAAREFDWFGKVACVECDLHGDFGPVTRAMDQVDAVVHLAWGDVRKCCDRVHVEKHLPAESRFLTALLTSGLKHLLVSGTCLEYGMQHGPLCEEMETRPATPYGTAKDKLRKMLQQAQQTHPYTLQWVRLFYTYGEGQNPHSLLAQLDAAIDQGLPEFNMSRGEQLRDYLPVSQIAENIARLVQEPECGGVINCCSGEPISVRRLVEERCRERNANIRLNLGHYGYLDYEPMAFWGVPGKLAALKN